MEQGWGWEQQTEATGQTEGLGYRAEDEREGEEVKVQREEEERTPVVMCPRDRLWQDRQWRL